MQSYRYLHVAGTGTLTLNEVTLQNGGEANIFGGAVYVDTNGTLNVRNSTFTGFIADRAGAIWSFGTVNVVGTTFSNNSVGFNGGAFIGNTDNQATIVNSTFANNQASNEGGAIHTGNNSIRVDLYNVTITSNTANAAGGGINRDGGTINAYNSIIAGNSAPTNRECNGDYATSTAQSSITGYNGLIAGCTFGTASNNVTASGDLTTIFDTDSNSVPLLANNGGNTRTIALVPGSPAINTGNNSLLSVDMLDADGDGNTTEIIDVDQRGAGYARVIDTTVDAGACEMPPVPTFDFSMAAYSGNEGDSGTGTFTVTVNHSGNTAGAVSVDLSLGDGNATPGVDFVDIPTTTLNFADGVVTQTFDVTIIGDTIYEGDEQFTLELENPVGGSTGTAWSTNILIIDDDPDLDVNGDGFITPTDAVYVINRLGSTDLTADVDGDGDVDQADVDAVLAALGTTVP